MKYSGLPGTSLTASRIVLGTAWFGTAIDEDLSFRLMDAYIGHGGNWLDTAHMYASWVAGGAGKSETTIGKWLKRRGREGVLIGTKGADQGMSRQGIRAQLTESLGRLQLESVDFYWLHRDDPAVPAGDIIEWLNELVKEGRFLAFGCSNWTTERINAAQEYAAQKRLRGFAASQIGWGLARVNPEVKVGSTQVFMSDAIMGYHNTTGLPIVAYSAQAGGFFGGAYDPAGPLPGSGKPNPNIVRFHGTAENYARLEITKRMAAQKNVTANQVAIAYLLSQSFPGFAIVGANSVERMADSCAAGDLVLTSDEVKELDRAAG